VGPHERMRPCCWEAGSTASNTETKAKEGKVTEVDSQILELR
jgi:hypothetical protein